MKNIFDFATKELSQDAFLSWFISSYDDETIGHYSYKFINELTGFGIMEGQIKRIEIVQQEKNIDIKVNIWVSEKNNEPDYVFIIEDKTSSSAHSNQLLRYAEILGVGSNKARVFYKTNELSETDEKQIKICEDKGFVWNKFSIKEIHEFFSKLSSSGSEILDSYINYIERLYEEFQETSDKPMIQWSYVNFQTFFKKEICGQFKLSSDCFMETWEYQGRLVSIAFYYCPKNKKLYIDGDERIYSVYPLVEFVFRKNSNTLIVNSHITYRCKDNGWSWKYINSKMDQPEAKRFMYLIKEGIANRLGLPIKNMENPRNQTISVEKINLNQPKENVSAEIKEKLDAYMKCYMESEKDF